MKEFIISIFGPLLQLNVIVSTLLGFILGGILGSSGGFFGIFGLVRDPNFNMITALIGAIIGFCNASLVSGFGLVLDNIRELLEEQNSLLEDQSELLQDNTKLVYEDTTKPTSMHMTLSAAPNQPNVQDEY
ncbi:MAG: hypothetical protein R3A44_42565 [Caldilineaceae bacterium]